VNRTAIAIAALALFSCDRSGCAGKAKSEERILVLGTLSEPDTLDPIFSETAGAQEIVRLLFRDLTTYDDQWRVEPSLAESLAPATTSTRGEMIVRWRLREGLHWSDGRALTAADVAFAHTIEIDPTLEVRSREHAERVARIEVHSDRDFSVIWKGEGLDYAAPQVHPILPRHAYPKPAESPRPFVGFGRTPISSGPYRLRRWIPGQRIELEPNPNWSGKKPELELLVWRFFKTEDSFEPELASGGIDALGEGSGLSVERAKSMAERLEKTHVLHLTDSGTWLHLDARLDHPITRELEVRKAIHLAIDRRALAKLVYDGAAEPAGGCFPSRHPAHSKITAPDQDLEHAARILESAGWVKSADGIRTKNGTRLRLGLALASGSEASSRAAAYLESELEKLGFEIDLETMPIAVLFERMRKKEHAPLDLYAWRLRPDWDLVSVLKTGGAQNYTGLSDPEIDRLLEEALRSKDPVRWAERLSRVEARFQELLPSIPLLFRSSASLRPKWLEGWRPTGTTTPVTWNAESWGRPD
jgi:peptide/nickel transport system substrate-binding protein